MRTSRFGPELQRIVVASAEAGRSVTDVCKDFGITRVTFYRWKAALAGQGDGTDAEGRLGALARENQALLKALHAADLTEAQRRAIAGSLHATLARPARPAKPVSPVPYSTGDQKVRERLIAHAREHRRAGYRRLHRLMLEEGLVVGPGRSYRIYREAGLGLLRKLEGRYGPEVRGLPAPATRPHERWNVTMLEGPFGSGASAVAWRFVDAATGQCLHLEVARHWQPIRFGKILNELTITHGPPTSILLESDVETPWTALRSWAFRHHITLYRAAARHTPLARNLHARNCPTVPALRRAIEAWSPSPEV